MNNEHRQQEDHNNKVTLLGTLRYSHLATNLANQVGAKEKCYHDTGNTTRGGEKEDKNQQKNITDEAANLKINHARQTLFKLLLFHLKGFFLKSMETY